jgi:DNA replication and repair protein RecF
MDLELLRLKPALVPVYHAFRSALSERNKILKLLYIEPGRQSRQTSSLQKALAAYTDQLVTAGTQIMRERRGLVKVLDSWFNPLYGSIAPPGGESVNLVHNCQVELAPDDAAVDSYRALLQEATDTEAMLRYTTVGPHRDDLMFKLNHAKDLRRYGSQGQQRSAALALRLALCLLSRRRLSDDPVLLLDDALSELDDQRKEGLLKHISKQQQVFIATASQRELGLIAPFSSKVYRIASGNIIQPA